MTTGEFLLSRSSLASGTALAHLLAMQGGSGVERTVFVSQMTVLFEEGRVSASHEPSTAHAVAAGKKRIDVTKPNAAIYLVSRTTRSSIAQGKKNRVLISTERRG